MELSRSSDNTLKAILTRKDWLGIQGCIRETHSRLSDSQARSRIGLDRNDIDNLFHYFLYVRRNGNPDLLRQSPTLLLSKINEDEYHLTLSHREGDVIVKCLETALQLVPNREFQTLLGVYPMEATDLLEQFRGML